MHVSIGECVFVFVWMSIGIIYVCKWFCAYCSIRKLAKQVSEVGRLWEMIKSKEGDFSMAMKRLIIIIIIIMSRYQHGYSWPSLATPSYRPLLSADPQGYIPYRHRAAACRFAFVRPCEGVLRNTPLTSSSQLLQQCPACLVRLILIVFVIGVKWPYSCCFVGCCLQDLFNIARSILV